MDLKLRPRPPFDPAPLLGFFARRAVAGVEAVTDGAYRRSLRLVGGVAVVELRPRHDAIRVRATVADPADRDVVEAACRTLFDLDAEPSRVLEVLGSDPVIGDTVRAAPGRRVPGHPDPAELAIRAVIGQQVSVAGAATHAGRLVAEFGPPLAEPVDGVTHLFPAPAALAALDPESLPMPRARGRALIGLAAALASGELDLDPGADPAAARERLLGLTGVGPWTADYVAVRGLGDRDAFLASDLGVRRALERLGEDGSPRAAAALAERWRPYRAYALQHLWSTLETKERRIK